MTSRNQFQDPVILALSNAVKEVQRITCESPQTITESMAAAVQLCTELDLILRNGLKEKYKGAYWKYARLFSRKTVISLIESLKHVKTDIGRGRAWIRLALNEVSMESYFRMFTDDSHEKTAFYEPTAVLFDTERMLLLMTILSGLDFVSFGLATDVGTLDPSKGGVVAFDSAIAAVEARQRTYSAPVSTLRQLTDNTTTTSRPSEVHHAPSPAASTADSAVHQDEPKSFSTPGRFENPPSQFPTAHPSTEFVSPVAQDTTKTKKQQMKKKGLKKKKKTIVVDLGDDDDEQSGDESSTVPDDSTPTSSVAPSDPSGSRLPSSLPSETSLGRASSSGFRGVLASNTSIDQPSLDAEELRRLEAELAEQQRAQLELQQRQLELERRRRELLVAQQPAQSETQAPSMRSQGSSSSATSFSTAIPRSASVGVNPTRVGSMPASQNSGVSQPSEGRNIGMSSNHAGSSSSTFATSFNERSLPTSQMYSSEGPSRSAVSLPTTPVRPSQPLKQNVTEDLEPDPAGTPSAATKRSLFPSAASVAAPSSTVSVESVMPSKYATQPPSSSTSIATVSSYGMPPAAEATAASRPVDSRLRSRTADVSASTPSNSGAASTVAVAPRATTAWTAALSPALPQVPTASMAAEPLLGSSSKTDSSSTRADAESASREQPLSPRSDVSDSPAKTVETLKGDGSLAYVDCDANKELLLRFQYFKHDSERVHSIFAVGMYDGCFEFSVEMVVSTHGVYFLRANQTPAAAHPYWVAAYVPLLNVNYIERWLQSQGFTLVAKNKDSVRMSVAVVTGDGVRRGVVKAITSECVRAIQAACGIASEGTHTLPVTAADSARRDALETILSRIEDSRKFATYQVCYVKVTNREIRDGFDDLVIKEGSLLLQEKTLFTTSWKPQWFAVRGNTIFQYNRKESKSSKANIRLKDDTVKITFGETEDQPYCMEITNAQGGFHLAFPSVNARHEWYAALMQRPTQVVYELGTPQPPPTAASRVSSRSTLSHSDDTWIMVEEPTENWLAVSVVVSASTIHVFKEDHSAVKFRPLAHRDLSLISSLHLSRGTPHVVEVRFDEDDESGPSWDDGQSNLRWTLMFKTAAAQQYFTNEIKRSLRDILQADVPVFESR